MKKLLFICLVLGLAPSCEIGRLAEASSAAATTAGDASVCRIYFERLDGTSLLAKVWNTSNRTVRVTISCYATTPPFTERLPDQEYELGPGKTAVLGRTVDGATRYTHSVIGVE